VSKRGDADYTSIGEALQDAVDGVKIMVRPGVYAESVVLDKQVEIRGDGPVKDIIIRSKGKPCVGVQTVAARLSGLTLVGLPGNGEPAAALDIAEGEVFVEKCDITSGALDAVAIHGAGVNPVLRKCALHGAKRHGVLVHNDARPTLDSCEVFQNGSA